MPLRITIELIPHGDENQRRNVAVVNMTNDGTGTEEFGSYSVYAEGDIVGGYDTFYQGTLRGIQRGDYLRQAVQCLQQIIDETTPVTPSSLT